MAYYYVKSGGTATGDGGRHASQQTGAWSGTTSEYYSDIQTAVDSSTTPPAHGDFICISNASSYSAAASTTLNSLPTLPGAGLTIVCVDDSNRENSAVASSALESITGSTSDYLMNDTADGVLNVYGLYISSEDDIQVGSADGSITNCVKCTFGVGNGAGDIFLFNANDGEEVNLIDCDIIFGNTGANMNAARHGARVLMVGGSVTGKTDLIDATHAVNGGGYTEFVGVDLSAITDSLVNDDSTSNSADGCKIVFKRCQLASGVEYLDSVGGALSWGQRLEVYNSAHDSTAEWQYYIAEEACDAEATSSTYRNQSVAWPVTGSKTSIAVDTATSGNATVSRPFTFDLPSRYAALSSTATDLITIYLSGQAGLTDKDVWAVAIYPDGTNAHVPNHEVSSSLTDYADAFDPFRTGTALTTDTGSTWTSGGAANYRIEIDTSGDPGTDSVPIIRIFVADLSATLYIDSQVDLS